jgi:hypothetical protein
MKKIIITICLSILCTTIFAQTPEEIIEKYIKNMGGLEHWKNVKNIRMKRSNSFKEGENFVSIISVIPQKALRYETVLETGQSQMIYGFYDQKGWRINAPLAEFGKLQVMDMAQEDVSFYKIQTDFLFGLGDYKMKGSVLTYEGTRTVDGVDCYYLKMATNESKIIKYYISISSNDLLMIKGEIPVLGISSLRKVEVELSDYKVVNGLKFPFKMNFSSEGFINGQKNYYKTEEVLVNTDLDLSIFQKPLR